MLAIPAKDPLNQEVRYESFTSSRFSSAIPPGQFQKKNTIKACEFVLTRFTAHFGKRDLAGISNEEVLNFLLLLTKGNKQATKRNRYSVLSTFYNFSINNVLPALTNPRNTAVIKKIFKRPHAIQWQIVDKGTIDEIIFRTTNVRNRLMLELMASSIRSKKAMSVDFGRMEKAKHENKQQNTYKKHVLYENCSKYFNCP